MAVLLALGTALAQRNSPSEKAAPQPPSQPSSSEDWSRKVRVLTADNPTNGGWLESTIEWRGRGPYDGQVKGVVHDRGADDLCAVAQAWYDGNVVTLGEACGPATSTPVEDVFQQTKRALVRVCLRKNATAEPQQCSEWS